jgi:hypothetical protein
MRALLLYQKLIHLESGDAELDQVLYAPWAGTVFQDRLKSGDTTGASEEAGAAANVPE